MFDFETIMNNDHCDDFISCLDFNLMAPIHCRRSIGEQTHLHVRLPEVDTFTFSFLGEVFLYSNSCKSLSSSAFTRS